MRRTPGATWSWQARKLSFRCFRGNGPINSLILNLWFPNRKTVDSCCKQLVCGKLVWQSQDTNTRANTEIYSIRLSEWPGQGAAGHLPCASSPSQEEVRAEGYVCSPENPDRRCFLKDKLWGMINRHSVSIWLRAEHHPNSHWERHPGSSNKWPSSTSSANIY
jgi:hypothetical protein